MIASADNHTIRKANEAMHDIGVVPMRPAGLAGIGLLCGGAAQPAESEPRLLPMPTGRRTGDADRWAAAWVTKATGAELRRLAHFSFRRSEEKVDPRTVSQTGAWAHFINKLERCVVAHTRAELGVANVERSRRFSACDALDTAKTAVIALKYKLQVRSPELIEEFCSLAQQLVENARRFVAADFVLQRVLTNRLTSSEEQRREAIVSAINAEMEKRSPAGRQR